MSERKRTRKGKMVEDRPIKRMSFRLSGPKHFFQYPDSVHILEFLVLNMVQEGEAGKEAYRKSVPITTDELRDLRDTINAWIGPDPPAAL